MSDPESTETWVYVRRDATGALLAVSREALPGHEERLSSDDAELLSWMQRLTPRKAALQESDLSLIRALEDLIDALLRKDVLRLTDLPDSVQEKLLNRRRLRGSVRSLDLLGDDRSMF